MSLFDIEKTIFPEKSIRNMLHCLGVSHTSTNDYIQPNKRYSPYPTSYRNHYQDKDNLEWKELVEKGYAEYQEGLEDWQCFYRVNEKGKQYLKSLGYKWHERKSKK